jgi:hypothetical protein
MPGNCSGQEKSSIEESRFSPIPKTCAEPWLNLATRQKLRSGAAFLATQPDPLDRVRVAFKAAHINPATG